MSTPKPVVLIAQYAGWCMSCGAEVEVGQRVKWVKNVGTWHEDCAPPRSLAMYAKEASERPKGLGL